MQKRSSERGVWHLTLKKTWREGLQLLSYCEWWKEGVWRLVRGYNWDAEGAAQDTPGDLM